jgi:excisionase family DNA binding protein
MADDSLISLHDAAERLGVHYMTAYRYVRTGRLPATLVDGRWAVKRRDVDALRSVPSSPRRTMGSDLGRHRERLRARMLAGDEAGAWSVVEAALVSGVAPTEIHLGVVAPILRQIGVDWASGVLSIAEEHRASAVAQRLVGRLGPRFLHRGRTRGTVVVGAAPGDTHGLPIALVADILRDARYTVVDLGANTPTESFASTAAAVDRLRAVGISVATAGNDRAVRRAVRTVRAAVPGIPVLVGGPSVLDAAEARRLGADAWAPDATGVATFLDADGAGR